MVHDTSTIHIRDGVGAIFETPQFEETNVGMLSRPDEEMDAEGTFGDSSAPLGKDEASSSRPTGDASPIDGDKEKGVIDKGDRSSSDMDPDDIKMIDEGTTQIEVRMGEGGIKDYQDSQGS